MVPEPVTDVGSADRGAGSADHRVGRPLGAPGPDPSAAVAAGSTGPQLLTVDRVGPGGGVASDSAFGVALVTLWQRVAETGVPVGFARPVARADVAARAAGLVDEVRTGRVIAVAANQARRLVGAGFLRPGRGSGQHTGHLELILLDAEHVRAGLGTRLVSRLVELATDAGLERLDVQIPADAGLLEFFGTLGFAEWGRRPQWIRMAPGDDRDEIVLGVQL